MAALLALLSAVAYGASDFTGGLAARRAAAIGVVLVSNGLSLVLALLAVWLVPGSRPVAADLAWGAAAGAVGVVGVVLLYRGLALGPMAVVAPLTAVLSASVPVVVGIARGDRPGWLAVAGMTLALPALVAIGRPVARSGGARISWAALGAALCAGVSFGGFYVLLAQTGPDSGAWPLVTQRSASVLLLLLGLPLAASMTAGPVLPRGPALRLGLAAGLTDFAANLTYVLATHRGLLALVAVISSLYPATTVLLARGVLRERISRDQGAGLVLAGVSVTLIALR